VTVPGPRGAVTIGSNASMARNFVNGADFSLSVELRFQNGVVCTLTANGHDRPTVNITQPASGAITSLFTIQANAADTDSGVRYVYFYVLDSTHTSLATARHYKRESSAPYCGWGDNTSGGPCYRARPWGTGTSDPFGYWWNGSDPGSLTRDQITNGSYTLVALARDKDATFTNNLVPSEDSWQYATLAFTMNAPTPTPTRTRTPRPPATFTPTRTPTWDRTRPTYTPTRPPPTRTPKPTVPTRTPTPRPPATYTPPGPKPSPTPTQVD
jgi:hypothetical protein